MSAKPLTPEQKQDAEKLMAIYKEQAGITQESLASRLGFRTQSAVSQYLAGKIPLNIDVAIKFAKEFKCSVSDFSLSIQEEINRIAGNADSSDSFVIDLESHPDLAPVKRVRITVSAGISGYAIELEEEEGPPIFFRKDWLRTRGLKAEQLVAVRVKGRSMEPGLWEGDLVVINQLDKEPVDGEVFAARFEGEPVIKRMSRNAGLWWLKSDNNYQKKFEPKQCTEEVEIIGRVVYKQSEVI